MYKVYYADPENLTISFTDTATSMEEALQIMELRRNEGKVYIHLIPDEVEVVEPDTSYLERPVVFPPSGN